MIFCKRCLYSSNHPLLITFDDEGVCSGCRVHEEKDIINWEVKREKLREILKDYKNVSGNNYDCIIPISGARDSYFIVDTIKNEFGMNPLLVTYNKHYNTDVGIRNLANLRIKFNCDIMTLTVNPEIVKSITKATLRRKGSIYWHCIAGQTVYPVQMAVKFKVPLIVWGAHQGIDQVGMFSHHDEVEMTRKYRKEHDLMGLEAEDLINDFDNLTEADVKPFIYPDDKEIELIGVRGIYLNNYIRWDSKAQHERMIEKFDYESALQTRTFDTYNDVDCFNYSDIHDYTKYIKHGYGKVTDHACREIRLRRMTREQGIEMVRKFVNIYPKNLHIFLNWIGLTETGFNFILDFHRNPAYWHRNVDWQWTISDDVIHNYKNDSETVKQRLLQLEKWADFVVTPTKISTDKKEKYILIGKGV